MVAVHRSRGGLVPRDCFQYPDSVSTMWVLVKKKKKSRYCLLMENKLRLSKCHGVPYMAGHGINAWWHELFSIDFGNLAPAISSIRTNWSCENIWWQWQYSGQHETICFVYTIYIADMKSQVWYIYMRFFFILIDIIFCSVYFFCVQCHFAKDDQQVWIWFA